MDVEGVYAGLRPLLAGESESTSALSREHVVGHPTPGLVVVAGGKYTTYHVMAAEVVYAVSHEGARHLDDVLTRRTRISIETWDRGVSAAIPAASLMAPVLGWSDEQQHKEIEHYLARVEAERLSQEQPDDETADSARIGAPEIVPLA